MAGDIHHPTSTAVREAIQKHKTLRGLYQPRDPRFTTQAINKAAHNGYEQWHRDLDKEVIKWLNAPENKKATPEKFEAWLRWRYSQPDLLARFPNGF
jgi:hypothetical protein